MPRKTLNEYLQSSNVYIQGMNMKEPVLVLQLHRKSYDDTVREGAAGFEPEKGTTFHFCFYPNNIK